MDNTVGRKWGFTILELLIVISIMALLATLAIGAAQKAKISARKKNIAATIQTLELAVGNYKANENRWPFDINSLQRDGDYYWAKGQKNAVVFGNLLKSSTRYLDGSGLMTNVKGRMTVKQALEKGIIDIPIGYLDPINPNVFKYFDVRYAPLTQVVKVMQE